MHKKGNETLVLEGIELNATNNGSAELVKFFDEIIASQANKLGGMLLKTYDSDIFNNWIKTDWIDGAGGITEITSIDITANDGKLTMDALNLQQKVYNMLNRIAVAAVHIVTGKQYIQQVNISTDRKHLCLSEV